MSGRHGLKLGICTGLAAILLGCAQQQTSPPVSLEKKVKKHVVITMDDVKRYDEEELQQRRESVMLAYKIGMACYARTNYEAALEYFREGLLHDYEYSPLVAKMAECHVFTSPPQFKSAKEYALLAEKWAKTPRERAEAIALQGFVQRMEKKYLSEFY